MGSSWGTRAVGHLIDEETERTDVGSGAHESLKLSRCWSQGPALLTPCPVLRNPRLPRCSFSWTGETSSGEKTFESVSFLPTSFSLCGVVLSLHLKFTETKLLYILVTSLFVEPQLEERSIRKWLYIYFHPLVSL